MHILPMPRLHDCQHGEDDNAKRFLSSFVDVFFSWHNLYLVCCSLVMLFLPIYMLYQGCICSGIRG